MTQTMRVRFLRPPQWPAVLIALASTCHGGILFAQGAEQAPSPAIDVAVSGGKLTVDVCAAPLAQVLRTIAERAGLELTLRGDVSTPVTQSFAGVPLGEGIGRLARGYSLSLMYTAAAGEPSGDILTGVWVIDGSLASGPVAAAGSTAPAAEPPGQGAGNPGMPPPSSPSTESADENVAGAAFASRDAGWIREIQALTDDADLGSAAAVSHLGDIATFEPDAAVRHQAVAALGQLKGPEIEDMLTEALADVDTSVRARAVRGLRGSGTGSAVQSLTAALAGDPDPQVRFAAVRALASFPDKSRIPTLERALADRDPLVREAAARGLSWWKVYLARSD